MTRVNTNEKFGGRSTDSKDLMGLQVKTLSCPSDLGSLHENSLFFSFFIGRKQVVNNKRSVVFPGTSFKQYI